jgi:acyl-CoA hydrolase
VVFPFCLNDHDTLFGGMAMKWMDEIAYITATRYTRKKIATVFVDGVKFISPIETGSILEITGKIIQIKNARIEVFVEVIAEEIYSCRKEKAIEAFFTLTAINDKHKPINLKNVLSEDL